MKERILVAGAGNIFLGDDAFGVQVVQLLANRQLPPEVRVHDFGIRSFDLAYALLEDWDAVILVDAVSRGEVPGTLMTIEPDLSQLAGEDAEAPTFDGHSMNPVTVLRLAMSLGEVKPRLYVIGCEPADVGGDEGRMGLTEPVEAAVAEAANMVEELVTRLLPATAA